VFENVYALGNLYERDRVCHIGVI